MQLANTSILRITINSLIVAAVMSSAKIKFNGKHCGSMLLMVVFGVLLTGDDDGLFHISISMHPH